MALALIVKGVQLYILLAKVEEKKDPGGITQDSIGQRNYQGIKGKKKAIKRVGVLGIGNSLKNVRIGEEENDGDTRFRIENYPGVDRKEGMGASLPSSSLGSVGRDLRKGPKSESGAGWWLGRFILLRR